MFVVLLTVLIFFEFNFYLTVILVTTSSEKFTIPYLRSLRSTFVFISKNKRFVFRLLTGKLAFRLVASTVPPRGPLTRTNVVTTAKTYENVESFVWRKFTHTRARRCPLVSDTCNVIWSNKRISSPGTNVQNEGLKRTNTCRCPRITWEMCTVRFSIAI